VRVRPGTIFVFLLLIIIGLGTMLADSLDIISLDKMFSSSESGGSGPAYELASISQRIMPVDAIDDVEGIFRSVVKVDYFAVPLTSDGTFTQLGTCYYGLLGDFCS
jgi:hypothetical protein